MVRPPNKVKKTRVIIFSSGNPGTEQPDFLRSFCFFRVGKAAVFIQSPWRAADGIPCFIPGRLAKHL